MSTRTRPRNSSEAHNAEVARTLTNFSFSIGGDGQPKVHGEETMKFISRINRFECLINFRGRVYVCQFRAKFLYLWNLIRLVEVGDGDAIQFPSVTSLLESGVIQFRTKGQLLLKRLYLPFRWVDSIFKRLEHGLNYTIIGKSCS